MGGALPCRKKKTMYTVIEKWTAKQAFVEASTPEREALFARVGASMPQLEAAGVTCLGWGTTLSAPQSTSHEWIAVWQMESKAAVDEFFGAVADAGWYEYFEQVNALTELVPVPEALGRLMDHGQAGR